MTPTHKNRLNRRSLLKGAAASTVGILAAPMVVRAESKSIKVGMTTILSGRVAQLGTSSRNAVMMEVEKINATGGLAGRQIEMVIRDSKGQPQEAARIARELINTEGCELLIDAEASSGAFAVHEVARDLGMLTLHTNSETSSLSADPKLRLPNAFRLARQGVHDAIVGGAYSAKVAKAKGLTKWMTTSPDYAYGRDTTAEFMTYVKYFNPDVELVGEAWPKLFQPDYTEVLTKILQTKAAGALFMLVGWRSHGLHRPRQHLRAVPADRDLRGEHGRLHRTHGGEESPEGHSFGRPLHQDVPQHARECRLGRCLSGEV